MSPKSGLKHDPVTAVICDDGGALVPVGDVSKQLERWSKMMGHLANTLESHMEVTDIPGTSLKVSRIAIGTWAIGGWMWGEPTKPNLCLPFTPRWIMALM